MCVLHCLLDVRLFSVSFLIKAVRIEFTPFGCLPRQRTSDIVFFCTLLCRNSFIFILENWFQLLNGFVKTSRVWRKSLKEPFLQSRNKFSVKSIDTRCCAPRIIYRRKRKKYCREFSYRLLIARIFHGRLQEQHTVRSDGWQECVVIQIRDFEEIWEFFSDEPEHRLWREHIVCNSNVPAAGLQARVREEARLLLTRFTGN